MIYDPNIRPDDFVASAADARVRELLSSLPVSPNRIDVESRVSAKIRRRRSLGLVAVGTASLIVLLAGILYQGFGRGPQQGEFVAQDPNPENPGDTIGELELFAVAYHGFSSPVMELDAIESEFQAWFTCLNSLEEATERQ